MSKLNEDENVIASQSNDGEKIGDAALAIMQKSLDEIDKLNGSSVTDKVDTPVENVVESTADVPDKIEENVVETEDVKKEKHLSKENRYRKLQNDKYRALAEKEDALRKVEELEHLLNESVSSGAYHYSKSAHSDLDRAKQKMELAIENGDAKALIAANTELVEAISAVNELKRWAVEDTRKVDARPIRETEQHHNTLTQELANDWLDNHSYLQPSSRDYNSDLAKQVSGFINHLDANLRKNNEMELFFTEDYFDTIDTFIHNNIKKTQVRNEKSAVSGSYIGGVKHGHSPSVTGGGNTPQRVELSADEKIWCKNSGISENSLIKHKILDAEKGK
jgi:hypothetical protein